jgi:hypothetical protein
MLDRLAIVIEQVRSRQSTGAPVLMPSRRAIFEAPDRECLKGRDRRRPAGQCFG